MLYGKVARLHLAQNLYFMLFGRLCQILGKYYLMKAIQNINISLSAVPGIISYEVVVF